MNTQLLPGTNGGQHAVGGPLTTSVTDQAGEILSNAIDRRIVRVRPSATPIDQLSRFIGSRRCGSMTVEYYTVDTRLNETVSTDDLSSATIELDDKGAWALDVNVERASIFAPSDTVLIPDILAGSEKQPLVGYIRSVNGSRISIVCLNVISKPGESVSYDVKSPKPSIVRMGRAASELDVQTEQFEALPMKRSNNCQIFKMQVEQSLLQRLSDKEVDWNFSDQEEAAIMDMRMGMEKNFIFGACAKFIHPEKNEYVYLTGGIWNQAGSEAKIAVTSEMKESDLINLCANVFTNNNGSKKKILIGGTKLIAALNNVNFVRSISGDGSLTKWGIRFREIVSNFGTLYVMHSDVFDQCHHEKDGMIIDPDYITKYTHIPFCKEHIDLRKSGNRNSDAIVLTEASCIVLRHPQTHFRIIGF